MKKKPHASIITRRLFSAFQTLYRTLQQCNASVAFHRQFEHDGRKFTDVHVVTLKLVFMQNLKRPITI